MSVFYALCWVLTAGLVIVGLAGIVAPHAMARVYGVPTGDHAAAGGFARATAVRDLGLGLVLGAATYYRHLPLLVVLAIAGLAVSIADFWIAYHAGGKRLHPSHAGHGAGIVAFILVIAMAAFAFGV